MRQSFPGVLPPAIPPIAGFLVLLQRLPHQPPLIDIVESVTNGKLRNDSQRPSPEAYMGSVESTNCKHHQRGSLFPSSLPSTTLKVKSGFPA